MTTFDQNQQWVDTQYNIAGDLTINQTPQRIIPLQRPPRTEYFMGRKKELTQLLTALQPGRVVTLCGLGGIGKSALAAEAVWTLAPDDSPPDRFPDGIIFHSFASQPQTEIALETIARTFGEEPKPTPAAAAHRALAGRRLLLLLDSAEDADNLPAVLEVRGGCGVLVTSRSRSDAQAERQDIEPLASAEAIKLLQAWGRGQAADEAAVKRLSDLVGRLPLAVRLVGRYLEQTGETAAEYLEWLEETPIEALSQGAHREENVARLLEHSLVQVSETARQVLAVAGLLALAPFGRAVIVAALELSGGAVRRALNQLVSYGLLRREEDRFTVSHALIHTYARRRLVTPDEVIQRVVGYYSNLAEKQMKLGREGHDRLDAERVHMMNLLKGSLDQKKWGIVEQLASAIIDYLVEVGYMTARLLTIEAGLAGARAMGHRQNEARWLGPLGYYYSHLGHSEQQLKYTEQGLAIAREIGDRKLEARYLGNLGQYYAFKGQPERAIEVSEQSLAIARENGYRYRERFCLATLGHSYRALGKWDQAAEYYNQCLIIACELNNRSSEGFALGYLGNVYGGLGQVEQEIEYYKQALAIHRETGPRRGEAMWAGYLGDAYRRLGQGEWAIELLEQALIIAREIGYRPQEVSWLELLGHTCRDLGKLNKTIKYYEQALVIAQEMDNPDWERGFLIYLGNIKRQMRRYEEALIDFDRAIELSPDYDWGLYLRSLTYLAMNNPDPAQNDLSRAIGLARQKYEENPQNWGNTFNLALYALVSGDIETAEQLYEEAVRGSPPHHIIRDVVQDLADSLKLFPNHTQAQAMCDLLQQHLE